MLQYRYLDPTARELTCHDCKKHHSCVYIRQGHPIRWCCNEKELKPKDPIVSKAPEFEYDFILRDISLTICGTKSITRDWVLEATYPKHMQPSWLEEPPAKASECKAFIDILQTYYDFIKENGVNICSDKGKMTDILRTNFILDLSKFMLFSLNKDLKEEIKKVVKKYPSIEYVDGDELIKREERNLKLRSKKWK